MAEEIAQFSEFSKPHVQDRLVYIDPMLKQGFSPCLNPFELDNRSEKNIAVMTQELKRIIELLLAGAGISNQMEAIIHPCIATLLRRQGSDFTDLQRFMDDRQNRDLLELDVESPNLQHRRFFRDKFMDKAYMATKNAIYTRLQVFLNDPIFQNLLTGKNTIPLKQLIRQKKIIVFKLSLGEA